MDSYARYGALRDRCVDMWKLDPDVSGSVALLWERNIRQQHVQWAAPALFGDAVALIDVQRRELEAALNIIKILLPKLPGVTVDQLIEAEIESVRKSR